MQEESGKMTAQEYLGQVEQKIIAVKNMNSGINNLREVLISIGGIDSGERVQTSRDGKKSKYKVWECDEVQFHYNGEVTEKEIEADFDYWLKKAEEVPDPSSVENLSLEDSRKAKYREIASACEETIYAGVDVSTSSGVEHFSLTEKDQLNLFGKKMQLLAGEEKLEYHEDGHPCKYFSAADMQNIVDRAMFFVSYNTTYCNAVNMWIKSAEKASDLEQIQWGAEIPEEFQNEVLKDYMKILASGGIA